MTDRRLKTALAVATALLLVAVGFAAGLFAAGGFDATGLPGPDDARTARIVDEVIGLIDETALEPADETSMTAGAVRGLLESLDDPYAAYFDESHYRYLDETNEGEFFGIGVTVMVDEGRALIVAPIEGTPAFEAGLQAEDEIVSVDGYAPDDWTLEEVVARVRGEVGTQVAMELLRDGETVSVEITRARIDVPNTESELLQGDIGYVRLLTFNAKAANSLAADLKDLGEEGARGFILDLRDNPGGLLEASVDVTSLFVEDGIIVTVEDREGTLEEYHARGNRATDAPLVVLVNENSASASEIVAGALQDYDRATLVGQKTFGKGSVQTIEEISNGGAVKFTTAHYLTPKGRSINKKGLVPDVVVEMEQADQGDPETDIQLARAKEVLTDLIERD